MLHSKPGRARTIDASRPLLAAGLLFVAACGGPAATGSPRPAPPPEPAPVVYPAGVRTLPSPSYERARAFASPAELSFAVTGTEVTQIAVTVTGVLRNPTDHEVAVIGFPVGHGPFVAQLVPGPALARWRTDDPERPASLPPPPPPPAPPPPVEFVVAPRSAVTFSAGILLDQFKYHGTPTVEVAWDFLYWNEPKPRGRIVVTLPPRP